MEDKAVEFKPVVSVKTIKDVGIEHSIEVFDDEREAMGRALFLEIEHDAETGVFYIPV